MEDYLDPINSAGMPELVDTGIATEVLLSVKTGIRYYAVALTESPTSEVRSILVKHLEEAIDLHGEITELMMNKGWLHPYDGDQQMKLDLKSAETAIDIGRLPLFPGNTNRKGLFPTPPK